MIAVRLASVVTTFVTLLTFSWVAGEEQPLKIEFRERLKLPCSRYAGMAWSPDCGSLAVVNPSDGE